jgi:hypothetical protein
VQEEEQQQQQQQQEEEEEEDTYQLYLTIHTSPCCITRNSK